MTTPGDGEKADDEEGEAELGNDGTSAAWYQRPPEEGKPP